MGPTGLPFTGARGARLTEEELRAQLADYAGRFAAAVSATTYDITQGTRDRTVRRAALLWRVRIVPLVQQAAFEEDPQAAYISVLTIVVMVHQFLTEGDGRDVFGTEQPKAIQLMRELERDLLEIAAGFLDAEQIERVRADVEEFARQQPIRSGFAVPTLQAALVQARRSTRFQWIVELPMSPFRALEGVSSGAEAIYEFNATAREFTEIVARLPERIRWEVELLLYDIEDRETVLTGLAAFESVGESARHISAALDRLPRDLEASVPELRELVDRVEGALVQAREVAEPLAAAAEQVNLAGGSWGALLEREPQGGPSGRPFDIREWQATAREIGEAAGKLSGLAAELRALTEKPHGDAATAAADALVDRTRTLASDLVDLIALRILLLLIALFALLLAYRFISPRLAKR